MNNEHPDHSHSHINRVFKYVLWGFIAIAAFFLITEHRAHLYSYLPYLLLAACPLMHLFMHHGHGGHGGHHHQHGEDTDQASPPKKSAPPENPS